MVATEELRNYEWVCSGIITSLFVIHQVKWNCLLKSFAVCYRSNHKNCKTFSPLIICKFLLYNNYNITNHYEINLPWLTYAAGPSHSWEHRLRVENMTLKSFWPGLRNVRSSSLDISAIHPNKFGIYCPVFL